MPSPVHPQLRSHAADAAALLLHPLALPRGHPAEIYPFPSEHKLCQPSQASLTRFCSHIALFNAFLSAQLLCRTRALRKSSDWMNTQGSWRAVKRTSCNKQTRGKDYLCKVFWLQWFQVVLIILATVYFYLLIYYFFTPTLAPSAQWLTGAVANLCHPRTYRERGDRCLGTGRTPVPSMSRLSWRHQENCEQLWNKTWGPVTLSSGVCCSKGFTKRE